jgi:bacterioferritin
MDKQKFIDLLNKDLAHELQAVQNYLFQYATALGLRGHELREILEPEIADELGHAKFLADKIVAYGGKPVIEAAPFEEKTDIKDMIAYDLELELDAVSRYKERARQAEELGDVGLQVKLEDMVADETDHAEMLDRLLRGFVDL